MLPITEQWLHLVLGFFFEFTEMNFIEVVAEVIVLDEEYAIIFYILSATIKLLPFCTFRDP